MVKEKRKEACVVRKRSERRICSEGSQVHGDNESGSLGSVCGEGRGVRSEGDSYMRGDRGKDEGN